MIPDWLFAYISANEIAGLGKTAIAGAIVVESIKRILKWKFGEAPDIWLWISGALISGPYGLSLHIFMESKLLDSFIFMLLSAASPTVFHHIAVLWGATFLEKITGLNIKDIVTAKSYKLKKKVVDKTTGFVRDEDVDYQTTENEMTILQQATRFIKRNKK